MKTTAVRAVLRAAMVTGALLLGTAVADAAPPLAGPVRVTGNDTIECIGLNTGARPLKLLGVVLSFTDSDGNLLPVSSARSCDNVEPGGACPGWLTADLIGPSVHVAHCTIVSRGGVTVRGSLCNLTKGLCSEAR